MFNIIRIRSKYYPLIKNLTTEESAYIFQSLFKISNWEEIDFPNNKAWWVLKFLYLDWMEMENFNNCSIKNHLCYLYYIRLFNDNEDFIKIWISKNTEKRYTEYMKMWYNYEILKEVAYPTRWQCFNKEKIEHYKYRNYIYKPKKIFWWKTECFNIEILNLIN